MPWLDVPWQPLAIGLAVAHTLAALAALVHVLLRYRRPAAAVGWMFAVVFLPVLGPLLYLVLAVYQGPRRVRRRRRAARVLRGSRRERPDADTTYAGSLADPAFANTMQRICSFPITPGNDVGLIDDDRTVLSAMLEAIAGARNEVCLQTYLLESGRAQERLLDVLAERVAAGVKVRLLVDPIGSHRLTRKVWRRFGERGIDTGVFLQPNPFQGRFQVNFRNHRKILCIDGHVAFAGGRNWADHYFRCVGGEGAYRDLSVQVRGPVVQSVRRVFLEDWSIATGDTSALEMEAPAVEACGDARVRVVPSGCDEHRNDLSHVFGAALRAARESILIVTPYFVPGPGLARHLTLAALGGIEVTLVLPRRSGMRSVDLASRYHFEALLTAGVRIFLRPPPLIHAKAMIIDDHWSFIGSSNIDARSLYLNYELDLEVLGQGFAKQLRGYFEQDITCSELLERDRFLRRGLLRRLGENAAALLTPIL